MGACPADFVRLCKREKGREYREGHRLAPVFQAALAWGDVDNDGDLDRALAGNQLTGRLGKVYRNDGGGVFTDFGAGLPGLDFPSLAWADFDNDGDLDLAYSGFDISSTPMTAVFQNDVGVLTDLLRFAQVNEHLLLNTCFSPKVRREGEKPRRQRRSREIGQYLERCARPHHARALQLAHRGTVPHR